VCKNSGFYISHIHLVGCDLVILKLVVSIPTLTISIKYIYIYIYIPVKLPPASKQHFFSNNHVILVLILTCIMPATINALSFVPYMYYFNVCFQNCCESSRIGQGGLDDHQSSF